MLNFLTRLDKSHLQVDSHHVTILEKMLTLLQDIAIMHWNGCGVCGAAVQDQACRPPIGKAEVLRVKEMQCSSTYDREK